MKASLLFTIVVFSCALRAAQPAGSPHSECVVRGRHSIFASNIVGRGTLEPIEAARLSFNTFRRRGLWPAR